LGKGKGPAGEGRGRVRVVGGECDQSAVTIFLYKNVKMKPVILYSLCTLVKKLNLVW
jgi:hypothetical protein